MRFWLLFLMVTVVRSWEKGYPYNVKIHMFGNHGLLGRIHAEIAPKFTEVIDEVVYKRDVRSEVVEEETIGKKVLDIGCGVGYSTKTGEGSMGIDTSLPMIEKGRTLFPEKNFEVGHGEFWNNKDMDFDVVTIMYLFHEAPQEGRQRLIEQAKKVAKEKVIIVDIAPDYKPSRSMLAGEPYLIEYLSNVEDDLPDFTERVLVPGHVHCWIYHHS